METKRAANAAGENKMAEGAALELKEGARIGLSVTVYEDDGKDETGKVTRPQRLLKDANGRKVQTRTEDGKRFVQRVLFYPFPAGMVKDPITGKEPAALNATQMGHSIGEWVKEVEQLKANGGKVTFANKEGKAVSGTMPVDVIPSPADVFNKGFKLEIQGPVNQQMVKDHVTIVGGGTKATKATRSFGDVTSIG